MDYLEKIGRNSNRRKFRNDRCREGRLAVLTTRGASGGWNRGQGCSNHYRDVPNRSGQHTTQPSTEEWA